MGTDVIQSLFQILNPIGHADHERMKGKTENSAARYAVPIECIEMVTNHSVIIPANEPDVYCMRAEGAA